MKKNLFLLSFYLLVGFFSAELYFRLLLPQDLSTPWRIYMDDGLLLNKNEGKAFHYFKAQKKAKYTFGKYHNRKYKLDESKNKILVLGDSNPFGWMLNDEDTYIYKLAKEFDNYEFINSSAGGWGTSDQLSYFIKFCDKINPKYTFVLINMDDIKRSKNSNLFYLDKSNNLKKGKNDVPKIYKFTENNIIYEFLVVNFHTINFLRKAYVISAGKKSSKNPSFENKNDALKKDETFDQNFVFEKKLFEEFKNHALKCQSNLYLISIAWYDPNKYESSTYDFLDANINFFNEKQINFIDLKEKLSIKYSNPEKYSIPDDGHPNLQANELYFSVLFDELNEILD